MPRHVYWAVRCRACGYNEWIFLCHVGVYDPHKKYTFKDKITFDVVCATCGVSCPYTEKNVRWELGEEPDRYWIDHPDFRPVAP